MSFDLEFVTLRPLHWRRVLRVARTAPGFSHNRGKQPFASFAEPDLNAVADLWWEYSEVDDRSDREDDPVDLAPGSELASLTATVPFSQGDLAGIEAIKAVLSLAVRLDLRVIDGQLSSEQGNKPVPPEVGLLETSWRASQQWARGILDQLALPYGPAAVPSLARQGVRPDSTGLMRRGRGALSTSRT